MNGARRQVAGGIALFASAIAAMVWANSSFSESYSAVSHLEGLKGLAIFLFFLSVGIELRHEISHGSLSKPRQAVVPIFAAMGGMLVPVIIYSIVNFGEPSARGWGVPMSTDIAFAIGVVAIAGRWLPRQVRTFVLTVAVVDDSLTILMIAIFFTSSFNILSLDSLAGVVVGLLLPQGQKVQKALEPTVAFVMLPVFAFLSAGVNLGDLNGASDAWLVTKSKLGKLPEQVTWARLLRIAPLFGMCFTVAMLMSELSFGDSLAEHSLANVSVLITTSVMALLAAAALTLRSKHLHEH